MHYLLSTSATTKRVLFLAWIGVLLVGLLSSCGFSHNADSSASPEIIEIQVTAPAIQPTLEPYDFATSEPNFATLHGRLIVLDPLSILPGDDDAIFLVALDADAPVTTIPSFEEGSVPQADVDERTGEFVFINIPPGRYAVVAVTMNGTQIPVRKMDDQSLAIFDITESDMNQKVELGDVTLP